MIHKLMEEYDLKTFKDWIVKYDMNLKPPVQEKLSLDPRIA